MEQRLAQRIPDREQRIEFLRTVHYEAIARRLDPQLVLGVIETRATFASTRCRAPARAATCR